MQQSGSRERSAAFPFEIPYRLINMFSQKGDVVLDPFLGTGTTLQAALISGRNSEGYELDGALKNLIENGIATMKVDECNLFIKQRFDRHQSFIEERKKQGKEVKHYNKHLDSPVMTKQEEEISFNYITSINKTMDGCFNTEYENISDMKSIPLRLIN